MIIPPAFCHVQHFFAGSAAPNGAAVTFGTSGFGAGDLEQFAAELHGIFEDIWMPALSATLWLTETRVKAGPNATGPFASHVETVFGTDATGSVPPNTALLIEKRTALGGRSGRGRCYIPGLPENLVDQGGYLSTTNQTFFNNKAAAWLTALEQTTLGMVVLHNASSDPTPVTTLTVDPQVATQRRRLR